MDSFDSKRSGAFDSAHFNTQTGASTAVLLGISACAGIVWDFSWLYDGSGWLFNDAASSEVAIVDCLDGTGRESVRVSFAKHRKSIRDKVGIDDCFGLGFCQLLFLSIVKVKKPLTLISVWRKGSGVCNSC
jgi:hypothetical protein